MACSFKSISFLFCCQLFFTNFKIKEKKTFAFFVFWTKRTVNNCGKTIFFVPHASTEVLGNYQLKKSSSMNTSPAWLAKNIVCFFLLYCGTELNRSGLLLSKALYRKEVFSEITFLFVCPCLQPRKENLLLF